MLRLLAAYATTTAVALGGANARADDPFEQAHAIMREALMEHAFFPLDRGGAPSSMAIEHDRTDRVHRAEAEREAHHRAVEHGTRPSGEGSSGRNPGGATDSVHGGSRSVDSWGADCHDAAGNRRTMETHDDWMPGGGMGHDGGMPVAPALEEKPASADGPAPEAPPRR